MRNKRTSIAAVNTAAIVATAALVASCASASSPAISSTSAGTQPRPIAELAAANLSCPPEYPSIEQTLAWRNRVYAARALPKGVAQSEAMAALVRESLQGSGIKVHIATNTSPGQVAVADLQRTPVVNFDINLNEKQSVQLSATTVTRSLADNGGYYFTKDRVPYIVIGPKSIDARGPIFIREYAEHEMYHAEHHVGDSRTQAERELETWTHGFDGYFHQLYPYRMAWGPMLSYYDQSGTAARKVALDKLVAYYTSPPPSKVPSHCASVVKAEFRGWVEQRLKDNRTASSKLIKGLQENLGVTIAAAPLPKTTTALAAAQVAEKAAHISHWVAAGDLNGDRKDEVLRWNSRDKDLVIYDYSSGQPREIASHPFSNSPRAIQITDIDGDGSNELVLGEGLGGYNPPDVDPVDVRLNVYRPLAAEGWVPVELFRAVSERPEITGLEIIDFDGDGEREIVFSYFSSKYGVSFVVADRKAGEWKIEKLPDIRMGTSMSVGNVLNSGRNVLVVGRPYGEPTPEDIAKKRPTIGDAFVVDNGKRVKLPAHRGVSGIAVGDVIGDRKPEIVVGDGWHSDYGKIARGRLALMSRTADKWKYEFIDDVANEMRLTNIALADLDRDGKDEIIVSGELRKPFQKSPVRIYRKIAAGWRRTTVADSADGFALGDFDGNGTQELVVGGPDVAIYKADYAKAVWTKPDKEVETFLNNPADVVGTPALELKTEEWAGGGPVKLAALKGKVVLIDYWATWCAPCIAAFPELKRLRTDYGPAGFEIVGMTNHSQQAPADVRKMVALKKLPWPTGIDSKSRSYMDFGVQNLPHQILVDQKGVIHSYYVGGGATIGLLERDIRRLLGMPALPAKGAAVTASAAATSPAAPVPSATASQASLELTTAIEAARKSSCPAGFPSLADLAQWKSRVESTNRMTDLDKQRDSMVMLVREALGPDAVVLPARNSVPNQPHPADYSPFPVVNVDPRLGDKRDSNSSYYFTAGGQTYVVIGPGSIHVSGPNRIVQNTQHEMFHAANHVGDPRPGMDREVEVWSSMFVDQFHKMYPYMMVWLPLVSSYENASPAEQQIALHRLVSYYRSPPATAVAAACVPEFQAAYADWLRRRAKDANTSSRQLVKDLQSGLGLTFPAPVATGETK